jgi:hypothetical protein
MWMTREIGIFGVLNVNEGFCEGKVPLWAICRQTGSYGFLVAKSLHANTPVA